MQESQANILDQVRLVKEYWPLVTLGRQILAEQDAYKRALLVADAAEWLASKSKTRLDDDALRLVTELARTPQGEQLIRWAIDKAEALQ
jgi:hypothetical protein